jgi:hypothetical protein
MGSSGAVLSLTTAVTDRLATAVGVWLCSDDCGIAETETEGDHNNSLLAFSLGSIVSVYFLPSPFFLFLSRFPLFFVVALWAIPSFFSSSPQDALSQRPSSR